MARPLILALLLASAAPLWGADLTIGKFSGLNTQDNPVTLAEDEAQDLLNVNITPGGGSVFKRQGYGLYKELPVNTSTTAVHGGYKFQDAAGNNIQLWGSDSYLNAIVAGATPIQVASGTVGATWQCTDTQGNAYCFNSARDTAVKTNGAVSGTSFVGSIPKGTMATFTPTRLVVSGVSGAENSIYFSETATFTNFTPGVADSSPYIEVIASPGSRITHVRYACGNVLWWKDSSFGYIIGDTQNEISVAIVQPDIGTLDNSSAYYNGKVYFRGSDGHIYEYDCSYLTRLSRKITPTIQASGNRVANSWTQTTQADFQTGVSSPTTALSLTATPGAVVLSTAPAFYATETSSSDFATGSVVNVDTTTILGSFRLAKSTAASVSQNTSDTSIPLGDGPNSPDCYSPSATGYYAAQSFMTDGHATHISSVTVRLGCNGSGTPAAPVATTMRIKMDSGNSPGSDIATAAIAAGDITSCSGTDITKTFNVAVSSNTRYWIYVDPAASEFCDGGESTVAIWDTWYGTVASSYAGGACVTDGPAFSGDCRFQANFTPGYKLTGSYTSQAYNVGHSTQSYLSNWNTIQTVHTLNGGTIVYGVQSSTSATGVWADPTTVSTGTQIVAPFSQYVRFVSSLTTPVLTATPEVSSITLSTIRFSKSSGAYVSAVNNAPNITTWDIFSANDQLNGGTLTYYTRASTSTFTILSSTPAWTAQTKDAQVAVSTGTYLQAKVDFGITAATQTPTLNAFTFNWFEGTASDKAYIEYFDDKVWIAVSSGTSGLNNRVFRWDLISQAWLVDDLAVNGFVVDQGRLYLGSPSVGKIYQFGTGPSDDGAAINSYWKSKDFIGQNPWVKNEYLTNDWIVKVSSGTALDVTYQTDTKTSTTYSLNLYEDGASLAKKSRNLPSGKTGTFYNVKFGDNSSNVAWEVFGHRVRYNELPWRPDR